MFSDKKTILKPHDQLLVRYKNLEQDVDRFYLNKTIR